MNFLREPSIQALLKYMFKAYIAWSVIADIIILGGILYLILG